MAQRAAVRLTSLAGTTAFGKRRSCGRDGAGRSLVVWLLYSATIEMLSRQAAEMLRAEADGLAAVARIGGLSAVSEAAAAQRGQRWRAALPDRRRARRHGSPATLARWPPELRAAAAAVSSAMPARIGGRARWRPASCVPHRRTGAQLVVGARYRGAAPLASAHALAVSLPGSVRWRSPGLRAGLLSAARACAHRRR